MDRALHPPATELAVLGERVADRLRHLPRARVVRVAPQVEPLLDQLAVLAAQADGLPAQPVTLPDPRAWGDVVDVLAGAIVDALARRPEPAVQEQCRDVLTQLRRVLP